MKTQELKAKLGRSNVIKTLLVFLFALLAMVFGIAIGIDNTPPNLKHDTLDFILALFSVGAASITTLYALDQTEKLTEKIYCGTPAKLENGKYYQVLFIMNFVLQNSKIAFLTDLTTGEDKFYYLEGFGEGVEEQGTIGPDKIVKNNPPLIAKDGILILSRVPPQK